MRRFDRRSLVLAAIAGPVLVVSPASAQQFPPEIDLSSLLPANGGDGSTGFVVTGNNNGDSSGNSVSNAGDVNGDGIDDFIIGAHTASGAGLDFRGSCYLLFGRADFPAVFDASSLRASNGGDGSLGVLMHADDAADFAGGSVSGAGDVNADGFDDIVIGAYRADSGGEAEAGETYLVFGRASFGPVLQLGDLRPNNGGDGTEGVVFRGQDFGDRSGFAVSGAGDVNDDGFDDFLIGAPFANNDGDFF